MAAQESNDTHRQPGDHNLPDANPTLPITSLNNNNNVRQSTETTTADSSPPSAPDTTGAGPAPSAQQPPGARPLWSTREGRIAGYRRMIETNHVPEQKANREALIMYYEDGGKVPEGDEELWAVDGQATFGIIDIYQVPRERFLKRTYLDVSLAPCQPLCTHLILAHISRYVVVSSLVINCPWILGH